MNKFIKQKKGGFTLVETLVAISIFTLSVLALMSVLASGVSNVNYAKQKMVAAYLAQEGIEYVRNIRDTYVLYAGGGDWNSFRDATTLSLTPPAPSDTNFSRSIGKTVINPSNEIKIISDVSWVQGSGTYHIIFSENLFNWQ